MLFFLLSASGPARAEPTITSSPDFEVGVLVTDAQVERACQEQARERARAALRQQRSEERKRAFRTWSAVREVLDDCIALDDDEHRARCAALAQSFYEWTFHTEAALLPASRATPSDAGVARQTGVAVGPSQVPDAMQCKPVAVEWNAQDRRGPDLSAIREGLLATQDGLQTSLVSGPPKPTQHHREFVVPQLGLKAALQRKADNERLAEARAKQNARACEQQAIARARGDLADQIRQAEGRIKPPWAALKPQLEACTTLSDSDLRARCTEALVAFTRWASAQLLSAEAVARTAALSCGTYLITGHLQVEQPTVMAPIRALQTRLGQDPGPEIRLGYSPAPASGVRVANPEKILSKRASAVASLRKPFPVPDLQPTLCAGEAEKGAAARQDTALNTAVQELADKASSAWRALAPQLEACTSLADQTPCVTKTEEFLAWLDGLEATHARIEATVPTACGQTPVSVPAQTRPVPAYQTKHLVRSAQQMLRRLRGLDGYVPILHLKVKRQISPRFPDQARTLDIREATCTGEVFVDESGKVQDVLVSGCPEAFHETTRNALLGWWFYPHKDEQGARTKASTTLKIRFKYQ